MSVFNEHRKEPDSKISEDVKLKSGKIRNGNCVILFGISIPLRHC